MNFLAFNKSLEKRFLQKIFATEDGCWVWKGQITKPPKNNKRHRGYGYGYWSLRVNGKKRKFLAHRLSYQLFKGHINPELTIDHLCRNRDCVNPEHLEMVTLEENTRRSRLPKLGDIK